MAGGGLEDTPITWMKVQIALVWLASGQLLVTGTCGSQDQHLWASGSALMLLPGVPDFLEGLNETPQKGKGCFLAV